MKKTPNVAMWKAMTNEEREKFLEWVDSEIARLRSGGGVPDCFDGTPEEMIHSLEEERRVYLSQ